MKNSLVVKALRQGEIKAIFDTSIMQKDYFISTPVITGGRV